MLLNKVAGRSFRVALMGSAIALASSPVFAQVAATAQVDESAPDNRPAVEDKSVEAIIVTGRRSLAGGLMKIQSAPEATSSITAAAIETKQAAALAVQIVNSLPGVNFGTSSPFGLGGRNFLSVRGLDQQQMGWVIEGMPGSDQSQNFPQTQNWADNENVADMTMIAGTTRLHDPVSTASGGEVIATLRDPTSEFGGMASVSGGSFGTRRYFGRLDAGELGSSGITGYGSLSYTRGRNFILPEAGNRFHVDLKLNKDWGAYGSVGSSKLYVNYTKLKNVNLNSITLAQFRAADAADDFTIGNYQATYTPGTTTYYKTAIFQYQTWMASLQNAFAITDKLSLHITPYYTQRWADTGAMLQLNRNSIFIGNERVAINPSDVTLNPNGTTFPVRDNTRDRAHSYGVNSVLQWDPSPTNTLRVGYWFDRYTLDDIRQNRIVDAAGDFSDRLLISTDGRVVTGQSYELTQTINSFNVADTQTFLDDRLQLNVGVKFQWTKVEGDNRIPGPARHFSGTQSVTLPRASLLYKPTDDIQIYANITTNTKPAILKTTFPTTHSVSTGVASQVGNSTLPAEYTTGEEVGFRYYGALNFDVALFHMYLKNRQISTSVNINNLIIPQVINVGDQSIRGVTAELSTKPFYGFSPYVNAQYLKTRQENDLPVNNTFLPTKGLDMVMSPKWVVNAGLNYSRGGLFGSITMKYVSGQYATFMNDEEMPGYTVLDASVGYTWSNWGGLDEPTIRVNLTNLNKGAYLGTVAGLQGNALPTRARDGTTIAGRAPNYYLSQPFTAMATLSAKF